MTIFSFLFVGFFAVFDNEMMGIKNEFETYHVAFVHRKVAVPLNLCIHVLAKHPFLIQLNEQKITEKSRKKKQTNRIR